MDPVQASLSGHPSPDSAPSKLQVFTIGTAAENLALNSVTLEITPDEHMPMVDGELSTNANQTQATGQDLSGAQYQTSATSSGTIMATWLPLGQANRMTAPNVRRGEQVVVYRFGDNDKYYWNTMRNDLTFRRLETVVYAISATAVEGAACDQTNTYFVEFSSHKKSITLSTSTSKVNGEVTCYTVTIDPGQGKLTIADDLDNTMFLDSTQNQWHIQNGDGSFFDMTKKAISMSAEDSVDIKTKAYSLEASDSITEKTNNRTMTATQNTITAETTHNGNLAMNGNIVTAPGASGEGDIHMAGNFQLDGNQNIKGNLTAVTIEATTSITAPNLQYN